MHIEPLHMANPKFEKLDSNYTFFTEKVFGKNIKINKLVIEEMLKLYCCEKFLTTTELSQKFKIPRKQIEFIFKALKVTHKSVPFLDETIEETSVIDLVGELILTKKMEVQEQFEKKKNNVDKEDALKWRALEHGILTPIDNYLKNWKASPQKSIKTTHNPTKKKNELIVGCSDWHYGLIANERFLYNQKEWNIQKTVDAVQSYADKLAEDIKQNAYEQVNVLFMGDISHSLSGYTDKGTKLEAYPIKEEQLDVAYNSMVDFVETLLKVHSKIKVYSCSGNHDSVADYILIKMVAIYFRNDKRIKFEVTNKRFLTFRLYDNLFLMEHGYSAITKNRLPAHGVGRENYLNNILLSKPETLQGVKQSYFLSCDQHHSESYELTNIEGYMFPTLVGGCRYADNSGYKSRPRQTSLVVTEEGVATQKYYYFD